MSSPFIGEIRMFGGPYAPRFFAFCNGQILSLTQNQALFSILGPTYGGDGRTTFALPDLRSRAPMHAGQGPGLSNHVLGERSGSETVTLIATQIPTHTHTLNAFSGLATVTTPDGALPGRVRTGNVYGGGSPQQMSAVSVGSTGGAGHNNLQPFLVVNFIICLQGIFPVRN